MREEIYETGWPLWQTYKTLYDDDNRTVEVEAKKEYEYHVEWEARTCYDDFGENRCKSSTVFTTDDGVGNYSIKFDYYPNGSIKTANLKTKHGSIDLKYGQDGILATLEKTVNGKKTTFNYMCAEGTDLSEDQDFSAKRLGKRYESWYVDSTGGFGRFDYITNPENFADLEKEGIFVLTDAAQKQRNVERELTGLEKALAISLLNGRETNKDSTKVLGRLEKLKSENRLIGLDIKGLDNGLIAVAKMYEHTSWERGDASWTPRGNGEKWTYELDGAVVDINAGKVLSAVNFKRVVRDSYDGSKYTYNLINSETMIKTKGDKVEFFMGDKYNTVASEEIDLKTALKIDEAKKRVGKDDEVTDADKKAGGKSATPSKGKPKEYE